MYRPAEAKNPTRNDHSVVSTQRHTVQEGDTLFSLAQRYYGDKDKFIQIYQVNREILKSADILTPGTVLTIPDVPNSSLEVKVESGS
jgi:nucleoid-associated protein YgaU